LDSFNGIWNGQYSNAGYSELLFEFPVINNTNVMDDQTCGEMIFFIDAVTLLSQLVLTVITAAIIVAFLIVDTIFPFVNTVLMFGKASR
jgi:hypothetical protein